MNMPEFSLITVTFNRVNTIADTIESVLSQTYPNIEYIVIDGGSTDGTIELVRSYGNRISKFVSEPDNGIYDAINKGIKLATGKIVGILHSDDFFFDNKVIEMIAEVFTGKDPDVIFGDALFVDRQNTSKIVRYYSSGKFHPGMFRNGYMPAHTSFYTKREFFDSYGYYKTDYEIAADYELLIRFLNIHKLKYEYLQSPFVCMRTGGVSNRNLRSFYILNKEIARACRENGIRTSYLRIYSKYLFKIFEFTGNRKAQTSHASNTDNRRK